MKKLLPRVRRPGWILREHYHQAISSGNRFLIEKVLKAEFENGFRPEIGYAVGVTDQKSRNHFLVSIDRTGATLKETIGRAKIGSMKERN